MVITPTQLFDLLLDHFGHQDWWPVDTTYHKKNRSDPRFEVMIGAILTQNTAWTNVEKALTNLKKHHALSLQSIIKMDEHTLKTLIQPSGFFNQKARRLKAFSSYIYEHYGNDLDTIFCRDVQDVRRELLSLNGIGPETADSILLYAGNHPIFVVDAYTKRICTRLPLHIQNSSYEEIQRYFEQHLQNTHQKKQIVPLYKELHALIVELAKNYCRKKPLCESCPLTKLCQKSF